MKSFSLLFIFLINLSTAVAQQQCLSLFKDTAEEVIVSVNKQSNQALFDKSLQESIEQYFWFKKVIKLRQLNSLLKNFDKNGQDYDVYELKRFVYKLERLAFANYIETAPEYSISRQERVALSDMRRSLLYDGLIKTLDLKQSKSTVLSRILFFLQQALSEKWWRWTYATIWSPQLVDYSMPIELARKVALEGYAAHRDEVAQYYPQINRRDIFNQFSKNYRMLTVIAIFTVFPYLVHDAYVTKMNESAQQAVELFKPLENYASQLAQVDQVEKSAQESLVIYRQDYKLNHNGQDISEQHAAQAYQYFYNRFKKAEEAARTP